MSRSETNSILRPPDAKRLRKGRPRPLSPNSPNVPVFERRKMFEQTDSAPEKSGKRRLTISGRKGGDIARSSSFRGSKKIRVDDAGSPILRPKQTNGGALWLRLKNFGHYDLQSMAIDRFSSEKALSEGGGSKQATGASAAQALASHTVAHDPVSNDLVASCPAFRNEIGTDLDWAGGDNQLVTVRDSLNHDKQKRVGTRDRFVFDGDITVKESRSLVSQQTSSVFQPYSGVHFPLEFIDHGATFYRNFFMQQEHHNFFGVDENLGPVAISLVRERVPEEIAEFYGFTPTTTPLHLPAPKHQYRIVLRTSELSTLRGTILEDAIPSGTKAGTNRGLPHRDVVDYVSQGELQLSCLKLSKNDKKVQQELARLDEQELSNKYKIGVLYVKKGQTTEEEMYNNECGSPAFNEFLDLLGKKVRMKGFTKYRAQLDNKTDTTGEYSVYTEFRDVEMMFHVSTLLPYTPSNKQQLLRKRHIGNDIVTVIFQEPGCKEFSPKSIRSHFQHIFVVVRVENPNSQFTKYRVAVSRSEDIPYFGPSIPENALFDKGEQFKEFILTKLVNACNASLRSAKFAGMAVRTRRQYLMDLAENCTTGLTLDQASNSGIVGFLSKNWGGRKRERTRLPGPLLYTPGALLWSVSIILRHGKPLPFSEESDFRMDCILGLSQDVMAFVRVNTRETVLHFPTQHITGWLLEGTRMNIFYDNSSCLSLESTDSEDIKDIACRMQALSASLTPSHEGTLMEFQRASSGLLGFTINEAGVVKKVDGLAKSIGLQTGSCLLQVEDRLLCSHTHTQITELLTERNRMTVKAFVVPPPPSTQRPLLHYPITNWSSIWANRPSHGDTEETSEKTEEPMEIAPSQFPVGGSVRLRQKPRPTNVGSRLSYVEAISDNRETHRATSESPAEALQLPYDDNEPLYDRLLNYDMVKAPSRIPRSPRGPRGHGREDKAGYTRVKRTTRAVRESVVNFADDLMDRNMGQVPPGWEPEPLQHTIDIYSPQVKAQVATSMSVNESKPYTAAPLSSMKHHRTSSSDNHMSSAVGASSPVPHTPGQVQELAKRFSFPASPTTPAGGSSKGSPSRIPVPSGHGMPMKAVSSATEMTKSGIPVPKQVTSGTRDNLSEVPLRANGRNSGRMRPMSWDSSLIFDAEKAASEGSKDDSTPPIAMDEQSFIRNSNIRHPFRKKSTSREFSPEPDTSPLTAESQLNTTELKSEPTSKGHPKTSRLSVKERTRRWEQRGGGLPSYFATLPRPPRKQRKHQPDERARGRQSSVPPADTTDGDATTSIATYKDTAAKGRYSVSGIPQPGSISKIPSPRTSTAQISRQKDQRNSLQIDQQEEGDGPSNSDEPLQVGSCESETLDCENIKLTETTASNHHPIIKSKSLSMTVGKARGQNLLPTKTQIPSSSNIPVFSQHTAQPVAEIENGHKEVPSSLKSEKKPVPEAMPQQKYTSTNFGREHSLEENSLHTGIQALSISSGQAGHTKERVQPTSENAQADVHDITHTGTSCQAESDSNTEQQQLQKRSTRRVEVKTAII